MGDAGFVYDSMGTPVWDGVREYRPKEEESLSKTLSSKKEDFVDLPECSLLWMQFDPIANIATGALI